MTPVLATGPVDPAEVSRFRAAIERQLGLALDAGKSAWLAELLASRSAQSGLAREEYLLALEREQRPGELRALASELTVGETYFFRGADQLRAFAALCPRGRRASVLSAGCSSGEEPLSLAMLAREEHLELSIRAVELNPLVLERARRGRYSAWALRETSEERQRRWFKPEGRDFAIDPSILEQIDFLEGNLNQPHAQFWSGPYDAIFCRNVLMYFAPERAAEAVARFARALAPGGLLFLGHAETLRGLSGEFHLLHTHGVFYYRVKTPAERGAAPSATPPRFDPAPSGAPPGALPGALWMDAVSRASERIRALAETPERREEQLGAGMAAAGRVATPMPSTPLASPRQPAPPPPAELALELVRRERYAEALALLPPEPGDADRLLLRASLLIHTGQLEQAAKLCDELLALDELSAGAHYLLALCREAQGDRAAAAEHDQLAAYLEPAFAMPALHLGLLSRRGGDREAARRELSRARALLPAEDASRLLLYGGGFTRAALIALCDAELTRLGDA